MTGIFKEIVEKRYSLRLLRLPKKMGILTSDRQPKSKNSDENKRFWFDLKHLIYNRCKISYNIIFKFGRIFAIEYALMLQETILCEFGHTIPSFITGCFERAIWRENLKAIDTFLFLLQVLHSSRSKIPVWLNKKEQKNGRGKHQHWGFVRGDQHPG